MASKQITVQRFNVTSSKPFQDVVSRLEAGIGHPDMSVFRREPAWWTCLWAIRCPESASIATMKT